jgi:hypothetical protein
MGRGQRSRSGVGCLPYIPTPVSVQFRFRLQMGVEEGDCDVVPVVAG